MGKICTMFSGSSGNCTYISSGKDAFLIDAGVSAKQILLGLEERNIDPNSIKAIFITHCHTDHISGLRVFLKKFNVPVYASKESIGILMLEDAFNEKSRYYDIEENPETNMDVRVDFFKTSHDCVGSGGYTFTLPDNQKIGFCTDLGFVSDTVRQKLMGSNYVVIESNHDVGMLQNGMYPFETKQRILSDEGHLSNASCALELPELVRNGTTGIILAHLSKDNNTPELAEVTAKSVLSENKMKQDIDYRLYVAPKSKGKIIYI